MLNFIVLSTKDTKGRSLLLQSRADTNNSMEPFESVLPSKLVIMVICGFSVWNLCVVVVCNDVEWVQGLKIEN